MSSINLIKLKEAEDYALRLFSLIEEKGMIRPGLTEMELNKEIYSLAKQEFRIDKFWHKRIVRAGSNTLFPYRENPPNLVIEEDTILFLDLGPVFEDYEADIGRTYVLGSDPVKLKLKKDVEDSWYEARDFYLSNPNLKAAELYAFCQNLAVNKGWKFGGEIAGHLVGKFPHEKLEGIPKDSYIHPENKEVLQNSIENLNETHWIIEIHFVDKARKIGGFFEQLAL